MMVRTEDGWRTFPVYGNRNGPPLFEPSITVVIFCWRILLISESMDHHHSEIMDDRSID
jgi:hypothetical protein